MNLKATLLDGSYHPVDSSEMAFKTAAAIAYKEGLKQANPVLLEPIGYLKVYIPENIMGDIIGDINKRRGQIMGMGESDKEGLNMVEAEVPMSEMFRYATDLAEVCSHLSLHVTSKLRQMLPKKLYKAQKIKSNQAKNSFLSYD